MNATLLIVLLSQQGFWISGQEQKISVSWAATDPAPPAAELQWELEQSNLKLNSGIIRLEPGGLRADISIKSPQVRVRTSLRWTYRLLQQDTKKVLESGERTISVFPADLTSDWGRRLGQKKLVVYDDAAGPLAKSLEAAKVSFTRADDLSKLFNRPELLLVAPGKLEKAGVDQPPLLALARAGTSVAVLVQPRVESLGGYTIRQREATGELQFRGDHPLFDRLEPADLKGWLASAGKDQIAALQLPANEPALELTWWPRETPSDQPSPIEALIVTKSIGDGRIVLCQLPIGGWDIDPRSQIFLGNLLSYLTTEPQPTPPPGQRRQTPVVTPQTLPTIDFSPGAKP